MVISHHAPAQFTSHQSPVTSHEIQLYFSRGRKGSGDLPGLQSRRFGPLRVEWWVRLPHASANSPTPPRASNPLFLLKSTSPSFFPIPKIQVSFVRWLPNRKSKLRAWF